MGQRRVADTGQLALDLDAGLDSVSLADTTFVVVDLETTGGRASAAEPGGPFDAITEIGAVKIRGGEVLGELATLVDPGRAIPPKIVELTGITTAMVCDAPKIDSVLPTFLEFSRGAVLVAHNAGFDIGFLRAAAQRAQLNWPKPPVLCTVRLARRVLTRDEAPSVRLSELARLFSASTTPTHRALDDARATVDVLHALIERVGNQGIHTYADLRAYLPNTTPAQRRNRALADQLPRRPGVYLFRGPSDEVLYVGTAVDLRRRVRQYFTGADPRARMKEMSSLARAVDHVECAHALEAGVRELRLLAAHAPPYNRRSKFPHKWWWVVLTDEAFPRFSTVRNPKHGNTVGPFSSRADATQTAALLARFTGVRTCTKRLGAAAVHRCPELEVSPCPAPQGVGASEYAEASRRAGALIDGSDHTAITAALARISELAAANRYETAARLRDHACVAIEALWRGQQLRALATLPELVAARSDGDGGWHLSVIRYGQLAAAGTARRGVPPMPVVDAISAAAQVVLTTQAPLGGALVEETALIARWLARPGVRIVRTRGREEQSEFCGREEQSEFCGREEQSEFCGREEQSDVQPGYATPIGAAGVYAEWAAAARSARLAAQQPDARSRDFLSSELLTEPHPSREQLFGRTGVDGLGGTREPGFPRRNPLGVAG